MFQHPELAAKIYLACEIMQLACPDAAGEFHRGLKRQLPDAYDPETHEQTGIQVRDEDFLRVYIEPAGGHSSVHFVPVILDKLLRDFMKQYPTEDLLETAQIFCQKEMAGFISAWFPDLDLQGKGFRRLKQICLELAKEQDEWRCAVPEIPETGGDGLSLLPSRNDEWNVLLSRASRYRVRAHFSALASAAVPPLSDG